MDIPSSFKLFGHTITVEYDDALANRADSTGQAHYRFNKIVLQGQDGYAGRPQSKVEQDFCHELMHFLLFYGDCSDIPDLFKNERVVDRLSCLLHQFLTTAQYLERNQHATNSKTIPSGSQA